jgi:hypothetical protein
MYSAYTYISTLSLPIHGSFKIPDDDKDMTFYEFVFTLFNTTVFLASSYHMEHTLQQRQLCGLFLK